MTKKVTTGDKTCLLDAMCVVLNIDLFRNPSWDEGTFKRYYEETRQTLLDSIGHDGSERGFHSQEIQDALYEKYLCIMVRHELYPCMQVPPDLSKGENKVKVIPIYTREEAPDRFMKKINRNNGVLVVRKSNGVHHALAFQAGSSSAYDVAKDELLPLEDLDIVMFLEVIG